jgi:hypothetical protein
MERQDVEATTAYSHLDSIALELSALGPAVIPIHRTLQPQLFIREFQK